MLSDSNPVIQLHTHFISSVLRDAVDEVIVADNCIAGL
jgi:hypothetical protein